MRLEAVKAQRAAEDKLASYRPYEKQRLFHALAGTNGSAHFWRRIKAAKRQAAALKLRYMQPADIPTTGPDIGSTAPLTAGCAV